MNLETQIVDSMKEAMKAKNAGKLDALRLIKAEFMKLNASGTEVTDEARLKALAKMVKQRNDSAEIFKKANRTELYEKEVFEISVIETFLPTQMGQEEIEAEVNQVITETGATSKDFGKVMGIASKRLAGKADGKVISEIVKRILS
jgi:hypothetical protein